MNWQHLIYFRTVAETQNFTSAAKELYITPSTLSKAIASLEEELHFPLFFKSGRNSVLTDYGKQFKKYVDQSIECIENGIEEIHSQMHLVTGSLRICGIYTLCSNYLPQQVKSFLSIYPNVNISIEHHFSVDVLDRIIAGKNDLGFCADFNVNDKKYNCLEYRMIKQEEMVIVVSADHPLSARDTVSLTELKKEKFIICSNPDTLNRICFLDMCKRENFTPKIAFEIPDDQSILGMVYANLGIACMVNIPAVHQGNLHVVRVLDNPTAQTFYMIWKKDTPLTLPASTFRDHIIATLSE